MCRNIKTLFNFEPPATEDEVHASALQFVRKLSGFNKPSQINAAAFELAVNEVSQAAHKFCIPCRHPRPRATARLKPRKRGSGHARVLPELRALTLHCSPDTFRMSISFRSRQR